MCTEDKIMAEQQQPNVDLIEQFLLRYIKNVGETADTSVYVLEAYRSGGLSGLAHAVLRVLGETAKRSVGVEGSKIDAKRRLQMLLKSGELIEDGAFAALAVVLLDQRLVHALLSNGLVKENSWIKG